MKSAFTLSFRHAVGLAAAGAALLCAAGASAQSGSSPFYSFQVTNLTASGGDPVFSISNDLTFTNLQINEVFADNFKQTVLIPTLDTGTVAEQSAAFFLSGVSATSLTDPIHGKLTTATLTGSLDNGLNPGPTQTVNVETAFGGPTTTEQISSTFSANLLGPSPTVLGLGQFSLLDSSNNTVAPYSIVIGANPVPEASTVVSMGLLLALGLGSLVIARRRTVSAN